MEREAAARELGRHYVAGTIEADELDGRLSAAYGDEPATALAGLPTLEPEHRPERRRKGWFRARHGEADGAQPHWLPTTERFVDPTTQRVMRVWTDPSTRERHYVPEP